MSVRTSAGFEPGHAARRLLSEACTGALATVSPDGAPHASLVTAGTLPDGSPVLLLSKLARHTENILADPRVSLLLEGPRGADPLASARISVAGVMRTTDDPAARRRFLARHPSAAGYADFKDFSFWRVEIAGGHLVAGFGRIVDLSPAEMKIETADAAPLLAAEESAIVHMNADHPDAIELYATRLLGAEPGPWRIIGIDPAGCDLYLGGTIRRFDFPQRVITPDALRKILADLAREARGASKQG